MRTLGFLLPLTILAGCAEAPRAPADLVAEEQAVREAWAELGAAFVAQDWDRYAGLWVQQPDLRVIHPAQGSWISGWDEFASVYRALVATGARWSFRVHRLDVRVEPGGEAAWVAAEMEIETAGRESTHWQTAVLRKHQGDWRIVSFFSAPATLRPPETGG